MRFIHTADIHLGAVPDRDRPWGAARARAIWDTFGAIIDVAKREQADLLLIAGDLFHRTPTSRECREVNALFSRIPDTRVVIIAGNHDAITPDSPYVANTWAGNVTILSGETMSEVHFPELNTVVHGFSYHRPEIREALYDNLRAPADGRYHILLAHGGDETHIPIRMGRLAAAGYDYVALGHIHQPKLYSKAAIAFCGSPEPMDRTDIGKRGYILGQLGAGGCRFRWIPCATAEYYPVTLTVDENTTTTEIVDTLAEKLDPNPRYLYRITLSGARDPEMVFAPEPILGVGQIVDVCDRTVPSFDLAGLREEHSHDLISYLIDALAPEKAGETDGPASAEETAGSVGISPESRAIPPAEEADSDPEIASMALQFGLRALLHPEE